MEMRVTLDGLGELHGMDFQPPVAVLVEGYRIAGAKPIFFQIVFARQVEKNVSLFQPVF